MTKFPAHQIRYGLIVAAAVFSSTSALAQKPDPYISPAPANDQSPGAEGSATQGGSGLNVTLDLSLAPTFKSNLRGVRGERLADANNTANVKLTVSTDPKKSVVLTTYVGGSWESDFEPNDQELDAASIVAGAKVNWNRGFRKMSPFASYEYEHSTNGFFSSKNADDHAFAVGADIALFGSKHCKANEKPNVGQGCTGEPGYSVKLVPSLGRVLSNDPQRQRYTPRVQGQFEVNLANGVKLATAADYQLRMFDESGIVGGNRQHWLLTSAGVDFAGLVGFKSKTVELTELGLGVQWKVVGQDGARDVSEFSVLPTLTIRF